MASSQNLDSGGDVPANLTISKLNDASPSTPWTSLPLSVCSQLGSNMDVKSLHIMRLVCSNWRLNVEQHASLKVKVDDSIEGNLEFVARVKVGSARILNWTVNIEAEPANNLFKSPDWLVKLDLCGKMPGKWKIHNLCQFVNLAHLVLRERALSSNNLTGHQYPVITFDPTLRLSFEDALIKAYEIHQPTEDQLIELKSLQTLKILRNDYYRNLKTTALPNHAYLAMNTNLSFICRHIKAPQLSSAHLDMIGSMLTLQTFLENHRTSLSQLFLPALTSSFLIEHEAALSSFFPCNLRKLKLDLDGPYRDLYTREEPIQSTFTGLQNILEAQTHLEEVLFYFESFPVKWIHDAFISLANSSGRTLRYLEVHGYPNQRAGVLDLEMLSVCQNLEVLHLPWWSRCSMTFRNIEKLPTSLKRLVICEGDGGGIEIGNPNVFKRLIDLEWLSLFGIRFQTASNKRKQELQRQFCSTMIRGLLGLRKLQGFRLQVHDIGLTVPSVVKMLTSLDQRIDPAERYPQTRVEFNFTWQVYDGRYPAPWSDRPFDEKDMEEEPQRQPQPIARVAENTDEGNQNVVDDEQDEDMDDLDEEDEDLTDDDDIFDFLRR